MTEHDHREFVEGCFRCDLSQDEAHAAAVWVDPGRRSGQPCIFGHRITVIAVAEMVWHDGVHAATETWELTRSVVLGACWYQARYTTRKWKTRWKVWADQNNALMWKNEYAAVADPPSVGDES